MKPPPFAYCAPETLEEALERLAEHGSEAKPLAGGQSLVPMLNFRLARPAVLVDLNRIPELSYIRRSPPAVSEGRAGPVVPAGIEIGAMTRQREAERSGLVASAAPLLPEALAHVAHPAIRNRGTVGGSVAHADPAAELPALMLALRASLHLRSREAERWVDAAEFFLAPFLTAQEAGELLVGLVIPARAAGIGVAFDEVARRRGDYALVGVAAVVALDSNGRCRDVRLAYVNAGPTPLPAPGAAAVLEGEPPGSEAFRAVAEEAARETDPPSDLHASADYRRQLIRVLTARVLSRACERAAVP